MAKADKQAVVIIHGIGEQEPMETLRGFVEAVWTNDGSQRGPHNPETIWSKPDTASRNLELRRLATAKNKKGALTDFYELYWAHLMVGTRLSHVLSWVRLLLFRRWKHVPEALRSAWLALWLIAMLAVAIAANQWLPIGYKLVAIPGILAGGGAVVFGWLHYKYLVPYVGDAARYLSPAPANVRQRKDIRDAGIALLKQLIDSGDYDRIIIVSHSLGTVIGYDVLRHLWPEYNAKLDVGKRQQSKHRIELEELSRGGPSNINAYRAAQKAYLAELRENGNPWCVTDFLTFGSPLAHADALMARDQGDFNVKAREREFPTAPPLLERVDGEERFSYKRGFKNAKGNAVKRWVPHHGAVFAPVRWTNLYFPSSHIIYGDIIGGPVGRLFGMGISDIPVSTTIRGGIFNHTDYFRTGAGATPKQPDQHIIELRKALNLLDD